MCLVRYAQIFGCLAGSTSGIGSSATRSVRRIPTGRPHLPRYLRQFLRPPEVLFRRVRELVRNSGALLNREFAALAALDILQQRLLDQVGMVLREGLALRLPPGLSFGVTQGGHVAHAAPLDNGCRPCSTIRFGLPPGALISLRNPPSPSAENRDRKQPPRGRKAR